MTIPSSESIADRVRFWEEQDKINQVLIPRVIKQAELLTAHIGEHENLPEVVSRAIAAALQEALAEQKEKYRSALAEQSRQYQVALESQEQQYDAKMSEAIAKAADSIEKRAVKVRYLTGWTGGCRRCNRIGQSALELAGVA